jgi:transposase
MRSWLPPDHLAWQMIGVTGQLDLARLAGAYRADGQGQAPYDPQVMLALVCYCYFKGIRSSRKIRDACVDDVGCRVIAGGAVPSHRAVAGFLRRHRAEVPGLFVQVLGLLAAEGAVAGHCAAIDGSPVSGNASRFANLSGEQLDAQIAAAETETGAAIARWLDGASSQERLRDDDDDGGGLPGGVPRKLASAAARLGRLRAARDTLARRSAAGPDGRAQAQVAAARERAGRAQARLLAAEAVQDAKMERYEAAVAAGKPWRYGKAPVPASQNKKAARLRKDAASAAARLAAARQRAAAQAPGKVSATDPDSRLLPAKNGGGWIQGWNLELAAARRQVLLAVELHDNPADYGALIPLVQAARDNLAAAATWPGAAALRGQIRAWLADNGFASAANFTELEHLMLLVAVTGEATQTGRGHGGRALPEGWQHMAARLATPAGKALYKRRAGLVEPAFAQMFARFGRYLSYRGHDAVDAEVKLLGTVHNIGKLLEHRRRTARRKPPPPAPA